MYNFSNVKPLLSLLGSTHWYLWCNSYFRCCCCLLDIILVRLFTSIFSLSHTQTHTNTVINNLASCVWQSMYCWLTAGFEWWQKVNSPSADTFDIDDESNRVDRVSFYVREMPLSDSGLEDKGKSLITESVMGPDLQPVHMCPSNIYIAKRE